MKLSTTVSCLLIASGEAFLLPLASHTLQRPRPLAAALEGHELEGQLNPANKWEVELELDGVVKRVTVDESTSILEAAEQVFDDVPFMCRSGVCTTCAGHIEAGKESVTMAVHGLGAKQQAAGFTLTCQTHPTGPGIRVSLNKYDEVYEEQYGQYEQGIAKDGNKPKKLFNLVG